MFEFKNINVKNIKDVAKKTVAIGAAAVVFGGAGGLGVEKASANTATKDEGKISSVENTKSKNLKVDKTEKNVLEYAEKLRSEQIQHYSSTEYLDKLKKELGGNEREAKKDQEQVIENLKTVKMEALSLTDFLKKAFETRRGLVEGFYDDKDHKITFIKNYDQLINQLPAEERNLVKLSMEGILNHEFEHAATKLKTSQKANKLFGSSYEKQGFLGLIKGEGDEYFSHPAEMLARKKGLDKTLEKLGIKKYGEEFTEEYYKKMIDAYKDGKFSFDVDQFILRTQKNPKIFIKIMNEIAKNENGESTETKQV